MARWAALLALAAALLVFGYQQSRRLDERFLETRYVVNHEWCALVEWERGRFWERCPPSDYSGGS